MAGDRQKLHIPYGMLPVAIGLILAGSAIVYVNVVENYQQDVQEIREKLDYEKTILHAAGGLYGSDGNFYTYTNSVEAMQNGIDEGNHFFEIDFIKTPDKGMICSGDERNFEISEDEFMHSGIDGEFTPMNIDSLAEFMYNYPDIYVITDVKNGNYWGCKSIYERYPDLADRFIIQVYHDSEYEEIRGIGFKYIIFTLYATEEAERDIDVLSQNVKNHDYVGITFWEDWMYDHVFFGGVKSLNVPLYVHTVDDYDSIKYDLSQGISAVYTDNTDNEWVR